MACREKRDKLRDIEPIAGAMQRGQSVKSAGGSRAGREQASRACAEPNASTSTPELASQTLPQRKSREKTKKSPRDGYSASEINLSALQHDIAVEDSIRVESKARARGDDVDEMRRRSPPVLAPGCAGADRSPTRANCSNARKPPQDKQGMRKCNPQAPGAKRYSSLEALRIVSPGTSGEAEQALFRQIRDIHNDIRSSSRIIKDSRNRLLEIQKKSNLSDTDVKELSDRHELLLREMERFDRLTRNLQRLVNQEVVTQKKAYDCQKKRAYDHLPSVGGVYDGALYHEMKMGHPSAMLGNSPPPPLAGDMSRSKSEIDLTRKLSESYDMQEKLVADNADLEVKRYLLYQELMTKDQNLETCRAQIKRLQAEMKLLSKENALLLERLDKNNPEGDATTLNVDQVLVKQKEDSNDQKQITGLEEEVREVRSEMDQIKKAAEHRAAAGPGEPACRGGQGQNTCFQQPGSGAPPPPMYKACGVCPPCPAPCNPNAPPQSTARGGDCGLWQGRSAAGQRQRVARMDPAMSWAGRAMSPPRRGRGGVRTSAALRVWSPSRRARSPTARKARDLARAWRGGRTASREGTRTSGEGTRWSGEGPSRRGSAAARSLRASGTGLPRGSRAGTAQADGTNKFSTRDGGAAHTSRASGAGLSRGKRASPRWTGTSGESADASRKRGPKAPTDSKDASRKRGPKSLTDGEGASRKRKPKAVTGGEDPSRLREGSEITLQEDDDTNVVSPRKGGAAAVTSQTFSAAVLAMRAGCEVSQKARVILSPREVCGALPTPVAPVAMRPPNWGTAPTPRKHRTAVTQRRYSAGAPRTASSTIVTPRAVPSVCRVAEAISKIVAAAAEARKTTPAEKEVARLSIQLRQTEENYKTKVTECALLRTDLLKKKEELEKERCLHREVQAKMRDLEMRYEGLRAHTNMMLGTKEQAIETEINVRALKQCYREAREEIDELRLLMKEQNEQLQDYRVKYMQAQQLVEEQKRQMDLMDMDNTRISEQINLEIQRVKLKFQEKLQELTPIPDLLKATQARLKDAQQSQALAEHTAEQLARELQIAREKVHILLHNAVKPPEKIVDRTVDEKQMAMMQQRLGQLTDANMGLKAEIERLKANVIKMEEGVVATEKRLHEKMHECAQLGGELDRSRDEAAHALRRANERMETVKKCLQTTIAELERQLAAAKGQLSAAEKEREEVQCRMSCQIQRLKENFEQAQLRIMGLTTQVATLRHTASSTATGDGDADAGECVCKSMFENP